MITANLEELKKEDQLRYIIFNGKNSLEDFNLVMSGSTPMSQIAPKVSSIDLEQADGSIDISRIGGKLRFQTREINYEFCFIIKRVDENGARRSTNEMNRIVNEFYATISKWLYDDGDGILKDTGFCNPEEETGWIFVNARCVETNSEKAPMPDEWVVQITAKFQMDPYMYEYGSNPTTFVRFAGPINKTTATDYSAVYIYSTNEGKNRYLWTNDNLTWIFQKTTQIASSGVPANLQFTISFPRMIQNEELVGFYINKYMTYTYFLAPGGAHYTASYHIENVTVNSGSVTFINSDKIATPGEFGIVGSSGATFTFSVLVDDPATGNFNGLQNYFQVCFPVYWGVIHPFSCPIDQEYAIDGIVKGDQTFQRFTSHDGSTLYFDVINFGEPFTLDTDPYNELRMTSKNMGFYKLVSSDYFRRSL